MKGILDALYQGPDPGSPLYVFTDASAKDATPENIEEVKSMAKFLGKAVINFFTTSTIQFQFYIHKVPCRNYFYLQLEIKVLSLK
jgi:hypothetical protein